MENGRNLLWSCFYCKKTYIKHVAFGTVIHLYEIERSNSNIMDLVPGIPEHCVSCKQVNLIFIPKEWELGYISADSDCIKGFKNTLH